MATVFLARLEGVAGFQRLYAIKRLHPHLANEAEFVDMFLDEARLAARIHHPNVVPILEVGTSEKGYYLVMEYIEGDTAARLLARAGQVGGTLPIPSAVRIALDSLAGLHAAHELTDDEGRPLQIVHRDVSPQNILVGVDGTSRITDFGVAHAATRLSSTRTGQLKGKLAYMAPEQARGARVDRRADVWAMGVVLWELLAAKRLFKASNDAETLHRILFAPIPTLRQAGVHVPVPLEAVCMRGLEREPENRYASAAEFGDALERVGRSLGMLSTSRDLAAYVDAAIGAEISQQREIVRVWLSRSEPSRNERISLPKPKARTSSGRDLGDLEDTSASVPGGGPAPQKQVSSVSSAILEVPGPLVESHRTLPSATGFGAPGPGQQGYSGRFVGIAAALAAVVVAVVVGIAWPRPAAVSATAPQAAAEADAAAEPAVPPSAAPSVADPTLPVATAAPSDWAPVSPPHPVAAVAPAPARPPPASPSPRGPGAAPRPKPRPSPQQTPAEVPDDLSHNPYR